MVIALACVLCGILAETPVTKPEDYAFFSQGIVAAHGDGFNHGLPSLARLSDDRLLAVWARYKPDSSDFGVVGSFSRDGGCRWEPPQVLIDHEGLLDADPNVIVTDNRVLVTCTTVDFSQGIRTSATWCVCSEDNGKTWSAQYEIPMNHKYTCGKCQRGVRLKDGTLLMPYSWDVLCEQGQALQSEGQMDLRAGVMRSADGGLTWANGGDVHATYVRVEANAVSGLDEPAVARLEDGSLYMLLRSGSTHLYEARSRDQGVTWEDVKPSPLLGTNAPASLCNFTVGSRSGLCVIWDNAKERFPLCAAASFDGGRTWSRPKDIGFPYTGGQASYPSCEQAADGTIVVIWQQDVPGGRNVRLARFSPAWLVSEEQAAGAPLTPVTIVLFGESTTAPRGPLRIFGQLLVEDLPKYGFQPTIVNKGIGGEITTAARARFETDILAQNPNAVTIYYGLNDAAVDVWKDATAPRVAVELFTDNLRYFMTELKARNILPILMTPNPLAWTAAEKELYGKPPYDTASPDGHNVILKAYVEAVRALAAAEHVHLVDVYALFENHAKTLGYAALLLDGVHPSDLGHRLIADALLAVFCDGM